MLHSAMLQSAIVAGSSGGIGQAAAKAIEISGKFEKVYRLGRSGPADFQIEFANAETIEKAAQTIAGEQAEPRLLFAATGVLHNISNMPEKSFRHIDSDWMAENFLVNAIGPALLAKYFLPIMPRKGRIVFAVLSARVGSISDNKLGGWHSYRASKAALNMIIKNLAIETARSNPEAIIVALHPGTVESSLSSPFSGGGQHGGRFTPEQAATKLLSVIEALSPADSGNVFDYDGNMIQP
jgi:NAD(P)-dependent dehydrogenase (short-subunit alcohol dehydrogenase family)